MQTSASRLAHIFALAHTPPHSKKRGYICLVKNEAEKYFTEEYIRIFHPKKKIALWEKSIESIEPMLTLPDINTEIIISTTTDVATSLKNPIDAKKQEINIEKGKKYTIASIAQSLIQQNFVREKSCNRVGSFSVQGENMEIWQQNCAYPIKIIFDVDRVESIQTIHSETKEIQTSEAEYTIQPNLIQPENDEIEPSKNKKFTIEDYFPDYELVSLNNTGITDTSIKTLPFFHNNKKDLATYIKKFENYEIYAATDFPQEVEHIIPQAHIIRIGTEEVGFVNTDKKIIVITDRHIFGSARKTQTLRQSKEVTTLDALTVGMYVVHIYHGIGQYKGLKRMNFEGFEREYAIIQYADKDKIYVPTEQLDRVERYIGSEKPRLHALGTHTWEESVHLIKKKTLELAKKLLKHYAEREIAHAPAFRDYPEEKTVASDFPFTLTPDQQSSLVEIYQSLGQAKPIDHLLCGDVGFGKTEIAIRAALKAVMNGYQVAVLTPTTVLTQQHFDTFSERLNACGVHIELLTRWQNSKEQKLVTEKLKTNEADIVIGTHRLLSKDIRFKKLGLIIIDEEQRFGVVQKEKLKQITQGVHVLTLSATPIPRTLHLSLAGLRPISYIQTPPPERKSINTFIEPSRPELIKKAVELELTRKGQVYILHNHVQSMEYRMKELQKILPKVRIAIAHGQMDDKALANVMHTFDQKNIDVLLCSTIIENGIDLPNVNTIIVEEATQFGLSQLYQLRGRIGRSARQAYAYFLYNTEKLTDLARERLQALQEAQELGAGLEIAKRDMEIRGVGNILGKKQHGHAQTIGLNLYMNLLNQAVEELKTGKEKELIRDISIDLPLDANIPEEFESNSVKRLNIYRKLAGITSEKELNETLQKYKKKKEFNISFENLFHMLEIKLLAQETSVISIDTIHPNNINNYQSAKMMIKTMEPIMPENVIEPWEQLGMYQIKAWQHRLGKSWLENLKKQLKKLKLTDKKNKE